MGEILELKEKLKDFHSFGLVDAIISYTGLKCICEGCDGIPRSGRLLIVANHPLGGADWLLIVQYVSAIRKDIKVVINKDVNTLIVNMRDLFIPVDTYAKFNDKARKEIGESLEREEAVLLFPSGGISIMTSRGVRDRKWKNGTVHFARDHKTDILPVYIGGRFSIAFYLYPIRLRRFLLVRNLLHPPSKNVRLVIGDVIPYENLSEGNDLSAISARLRSITYKLS
ncbi:MAG: 1-acyl-sn-glycerol-3-phosphate acyltransferase [Bacteroidales bacterium]|nr:1-acyl-sn-glycerol-3-phosphate acyltransferase [Bacteroidales bacterium]